MRILMLILMVVLLPMLVGAQTESSDAYYNNGLDLYNAKKYAEAIEYFLKSDSLEKKELDATSPNYYRSELKIAYCVNFLSMQYGKSANYTEAIRLCAYGVEIIKKILGEEHPDYVASLSNLASFYSKIGNNTEAMKLCGQALEINRKIYGEGHPSYATTLNNYALYNAYNGNYTEAIRLGTLALEIRRKVLGEEHPSYATSLSNLALYNSYLGNYSEAININVQVLEIKRKIFGENHPSYATSLNNLANYYARVENYAEAIILGTQALEIRRKVLGEAHPDYAQSLNDLAGYNNEIGKYDEAIKLGTQASEIYRKIYGEEDADYALSLNNLASCHAEVGNYKEAIRLGTQALNIQRTVLGEEDSDYALSLCNLSNYYAKVGNYAEAIRLGTNALEIRRKILGEEHPDYAQSLNHLALYNSAVGNYTEAIKLDTLALEIPRKALGEGHRDYTVSLNNLALDNYYTGNYTEAIKLGTKTMEIRKKVFGEEHPAYATAMHSLAMYNSAVGNYTEAIRLGTQALEITRKALGEEHPDYATSLNCLASYYENVGNYTEALKLSLQALEIRKKVLGEEHPDYATSLNNIADYYAAVGNYTEAIKHCILAAEIYRKVYGEAHPQYAVSLNNLAHYCEVVGSYAEAIRLVHQALEIYKKVLGVEHPDYAQLLNNLAYYSIKAGNYDESAELFKQCFERKKTFILKNFASMTEKERADFWRINSHFFSNSMPYYACKHPNSIFVTLAYNGQLLSKGLLLNAELEIQKLIEKSGDKEMEQRYYKIRNNRAMLDKLYQIAPEKRQMSVDSLLAVIDNEERLLVESSKELGDYTRNLSICWEDVQKKLSKKDIAIEVAHIDSCSYIALVLKKGMSVPEIVNLNFSEDDLLDCYKRPSLYNAIWKALEKYLQGVENVYFSPSGKFYTIGIEYLPDDNGEIFAKKYNAYRLSSTRELALERHINPNKKASVYGGIIYDFGKGDWEDLKNYKDEIETDFRDIPNLTEDQRAGITFLQGAKIEANEITNILRGGNYLVAEGNGVSATEESFKKLSGSGVKLLHIATHGFYEPENKEKRSMDFLTIGDNKSKEDNSLSRSGLFLAGAASALDPKKRKDIPEGVDDGILTAKEISRLDFKGLDLVVLSACQTGLGEVTSEGVFGLQRGFKKAGAQTIVMSLWKVDDNATKDLMTEFYKNLVAGKSKREAFVTAQDYLRTKYPDPQKWAAFVMVDGME